MISNLKVERVTGAKLEVNGVQYDCPTFFRITFDFEDACEGEKNDEGQQVRENGRLQDLSGY